MLVTLIPDCTDAAWSLREVAWPAFVQLLLRHEYHFTEKKQVPMISAAEFYPGGRRVKENVKQVHFALIDLDSVDAPKVIDLLNRLQREGQEYVFYTSWSHYEAIPLGKVRGRLIMPFTEPVSAADWPNVWKGIQRYTDSLGDPICKDANRGYFVPAAPAGTEPVAMAVHSPGHAYNPGAGALGMTGIVKPVQSKRLTVANLQDLADRLKGSRKPHNKWLFDTVKRLIAGQSLAPDGERNNTVFKLVANLLDEWPDLVPETLAALFAPSLQAMRLEDSGAPTLRNVFDMIVRKQSDKANSEANDEYKQLEERKQAIALAFELEEGRDWPYTPQELGSFAESLGVQVPNLRNFWIVQKHTGFYVFVAGAYKGPFTEVELEKAAQQWLAPAYSAGVELYLINAAGQRVPKGWRQLVHEYGSLATQVVIDLTAQRSHFDRKQHKLTEAPCPLRPLTPAYDPYIARWLELLAGPQIGKLKDWLAVVTLLNEPCAAIYLEGIKGCGKSMLAEGVARLWSTNGTTNIHDVMGNSFNSLVIECPLVFADETMPKDHRGQVNSGEFRRMVQARTQTLKRKYIADAKIIGSLRFILAANNANLMNTREHLTPDDVAAITDRVLHIDATEAFPARDYLNSIPKAYRNEFIHGDRIARHALWLRDNHEVDTSHRFLVAGDRTRLHNRLTTSSGHRSMVCQWLISYLLNPAPLDATGELLVRILDGELLVNLRGVVQHWSVYSPHVDPPETGVLGEAIAGLSTGVKKQRADGRNKATAYWPIYTANLVAWAEGNGFTTPESINEALFRTTVKPLRR